MLQVTESPAQTQNGRKSTQVLKAEFEILKEAAKAIETQANTLSLMYNDTVFRSKADTLLHEIQDRMSENIDMRRANISANL